MIHAPGLFAPLRRHDRSAGLDQTVVTVHDLLAWTHPESLTSATVAWHKGMMKRARKHADAVVVPTHALAERLAMVADFGDRVRVIGTAPRPGLRLRADAAARVQQLGLPKDYLVTVGSLEPRNGVVDLLEALGRPGVPDIPLVVIGPDTWGELHLAAVAEEAGVAPSRVTAIEAGDPAGLAAVLAGASAFVAPSHEEGAGTSLIEAFSLGTPVDPLRHPRLRRGVGRCRHERSRRQPAGYADRLAAAITTVVEGRDARRAHVGRRDRPCAARSAGATRPSGSGSCTPTS